MRSVTPTISYNNNNNRTTFLSVLLLLLLSLLSSNLLLFVTASSVFHYQNLINNINYNNKNEHEEDVVTITQNDYQKQQQDTAVKSDTSLVLHVSSTELILNEPNSIRYGNTNGKHCHDNIEYGNPCGPDGICVDTETGYHCTPIDGMFDDCAYGCNPNSYCYQVSSIRKMCLCIPGYTRPNEYLPCEPITIVHTTTIDDPISTQQQQQQHHDRKLLLRKREQKK